ncbi:DUF5336 domain-containing protein [Mycobacterium sp. 21AC1]|uniref:DUF5336 domain-containing protein n=1 Tax=[Mycobacterium] appelbergii TaxID=2939269 RepID=UPI00293948A5|nr:DUF5336 domain-containing protein [Mycobacterium sp. 21AC1]MDV3128471.1 DUF5336 domain-containing protein [Mycobacterium sp. 21AC1]
MNQDRYDAGEFDEAPFDEDPAPRTNTLVRKSLWVATGAFGAAAWAVGLAAVIPLGFAVPLSVLAGAVAVIGLLPRQAARGWLAVAIAVVALADAVTTTVTTGESTWVLIVVDVLVALQVVVAVSALLLEPREPVGSSGPEDDYAAYAQYAQAYRDYAEQYGSYWPEQYSAAGGEADAVGYGRANGAGTVRGEQDAWADMEAKYAQHTSPVAPAPAEGGGRQADGIHAGDPGIPGVNRADRPDDTHAQAPGTAATPPGAY